MIMLDLIYPCLPVIGKKLRPHKKSKSAQLEFCALKQKEVHWLIDSTEFSI